MQDGPEAASSNPIPWFPFAFRSTTFLFSSCEDTAMPLFNVAYELVP